MRSVGSGFDAGVAVAATGLATSAAPTKPPLLKVANIMRQKKERGIMGKMVWLVLVLLLELVLDHCAR
jgi:hypothetical protein